MSREHERLDRLLGLLHSETRTGRDLRGGVMARLAASGVVRGGVGMAWRLAVVLVALVALGMGVELWLSGGRSADVGAAFRRGVDWLSPGAPATDVRPASLPSGPAPSTAVARAPWRKT